MKINRYTLFNDSELDDELIPILFNYPEGVSAEKVPLTVIDSFTSQFDDASMLMDYLNSLGYQLYSSHFFVGYNHDHKFKRIPLVFSNQPLLRQFALDNQGSYHIKRSNMEQGIQFNRYVYKIINIVKKDAFDSSMPGFLRQNNMVNFLIKKGYMSSWLYNNVCGYIVCEDYDPESAHIYMQQIQKKLSEYKVVRDLEFGIRRYEIQKRLEESRRNDERASLLEQQFNDFNDYHEQHKEDQPVSESPKVKKLVPKFDKGNQGRLFNPDNL